MSANNIKIHSSGGRNTLDTIRWGLTGDGYAAKVKQGEPTVIEGGTGVGPNVRVMMDGEGILTDVFTGVSAEVGTNTAAVAGFVKCYDPLPGVVYRALAKTGTTADTQAEIDALVGKIVVIDNTSSVYTVDAAAAHATTNAVIIMGGDPNLKELTFEYAINGTFRFAG